MSRYLLNLTSGQTDANQAFWPWANLLTNSGVLTSTALTVAAQASPDMTVKVSGSLFSDAIAFITSGGDVYYGRNTASYNITITANSSGVTKTDAIVAYADTAAGATGTGGNDGALKFIAVRRSGTNTGNPTSGEIDTATGNKPWLLLAYVTVTNGASSISSGNISDQRVLAWLAPALFGTSNIPTTAVASEAWTSYTPTWSSTVLNVALGNGTIVGRYAKFSRKVTAVISLTTGSTSTYGNGIYSLTAPVTSANQTVTYWGTGMASHSGTNYPIICSIAPNTNSIALYNASGAFVTTLVPFTWANGDTLKVQIGYEAAS